MYPYRTVEQVVVKIYGYSSENIARQHAISPNPDILSFRNSTIIGRLKNLQRLGIGPKKTGKGNKISYTFTDIAKILFSLELTEFGPDPRLVMGLIHFSWATVEPYLGIADVGEGEYVFAFEPSFMTLWSYVSKADTLMYAGAEGGAHLGEVFDVSRRLPTFGADTRDDRRLALVNLSALRRCLVDALDEVSRGDISIWRK